MTDDRPQLGAGIIALRDLRYPADGPGQSDRGAYMMQFWIQAAGQ